MRISRFTAQALVALIAGFLCGCRETPATTSATTPPAGAPGYVITGTIGELTRPPVPSTVPYTEALISINLTGVPPATQADGTIIPDSILVYVWGMRDRAWTPAASWEKGRRMTMKVIRWEDATADYATRMRIDFTDFNLALLPCFLGEAVEAGATAGG